MNLYNDRILMYSEMVVIDVPLDSAKVEFMEDAKRAFEKVCRGKLENYNTYGVTNLPVLYEYEFGKRLSKAKIELKLRCFVGKEMWGGK